MILQYQNTNLFLRKSTMFWIIKIDHILNKNCILFSSSTCHISNFIFFKILSWDQCSWKLHWRYFQDKNKLCQIIWKFWGIVIVSNRAFNIRRLTFDVWHSMFDIRRLTFDIRKFKRWRQTKLYWSVHWRRFYCPTKEWGRARRTKTRSAKDLFQQPEFEILRGPSTPFLRWGKQLVFSRLCLFRRWTCCRSWWCRSQHQWMSIAPWAD